MAGLGTGAPIVKVYHEKSMILPDVARVLACLYEKNIKFDAHAGSYKSLLRLQATTHAPVPFYDGPTFLEESREICRYIAETYEHHGYPFLLGKDALERASIEQWLHHEEHTFNPPSRALFCHLAFPLDDEDDDIEMQKAKLEEVLEVYEQRLSESEFLAGNKFTLADLVHLPNSHYIKASGEFVYLYDSRKNVQRWWNDIFTRDSWKQVLSYMTKVEQQHELEKLEKQKQQEWQKEHRTATGRRIRLYSRQHTGIKPQTILVPPPATVSASPMVPQAEQPPADSLSEKAPVSSSQSTVTPDKSLASPSKQTTFTTHREIPPDSDQSTQRTSTSSAPSLGTFPTTQRARETASAPRETKDRDAHDSSQGIRTYDSAPSRLQPMDASHDAPLPSEKAKSGSLSWFRERPKPTQIVPYDARGSTEEEKIAESPPSKAQILGSGGLDISPPKEVLNEDGYDVIAPLQTRYTDDQDNWKQARDTPISRQMNQDAIEETKMADSESCKAKTLDSQQAIPRKQPAAEDPRFAASTFKKRDYGDQDSTKISKHTASSPTRMEAQDSLEETKPGEFALPREQPSNILQAATPPLRPAEANDARSLTPPSQEGYAGAQAVSKKRGYPDSISRRISAQDAKVTFVESRADDSTSTREQPSDAWQAADPIPEDKVYDAHSSTSPFQDTTMKSEDATPQQMRGQGAKETKLSDSVSPQVQPLDYQTSDSHLQKQEEIEEPRGTISPHKKNHIDVEYITKLPRDKMVGKDAQHGFEETKALDSAIFRGRAQPQDTQRAAITPSKLEAAKDALDAPPLSPTRYPTVEDTSRQPRRTAPTPTEKAVQDGRDASRELKNVDSTSSGEQPSDVRRAAASLPKQETADYRTTMPFQRRYPDIEDTTKEPIDKPKETVGEDAHDRSEETKALDSAIFRGRVHPQDTQQAAITPSKLEATKDARSVSPLPPTRYPTVEDASRQPRRTASAPKEKAVQDGRDAFREPKSVDSTSSREQPSDVQRAAASLPKQEAADSRSTTMPFQRRYRDIEDTTKEPRDEPKETVGRDVQDTSEETKTTDSVLFTIQPSDMPQAATTPSKKAVPEDSPSVSPSSPTKYPSAEDTSKISIGTTPPTWEAPQDSREVFREPKAVDSTSSPGPSDSLRASASLPKQEVDDARRTTAPFQKRDPELENTTKPVKDSISTSLKMTAQDAKDTFEETKVPDSAAFSMPEMDSRGTDAEAQAKAQDTFDGGRHRDTWDKGSQSRETISAPKEMVARDMSEETKTDDFTSRGQSPKLLQASSQSRQAVPDNARAATKGAKVSFTHETIQSPDVKDTTRESRVSSEETRGPVSTLDRVQSFGFHDTQHANEESRRPAADQRGDASTQFQSDAQDVLKEFKSSFTDQRGMGSAHSQAESGKDTQATTRGNAFSTERLREMPKGSEASAPTGQRTGSWDPAVVEKTSFVDQKDSVAVQDSNGQAQTLPAGGKADYSTPKHQSAPGSPSASHEKQTASAPPREKFRDDYGAEYPMKKDIVDDQKEVPPLSSQDPTSQVQHASETSQEAAPDKDVSTKSTIDQWRRASKTLQDVTPVSGDDMTGLSSDDQIPIPMGQETIPNAQFANEITKRSVKQTAEPPAPVVPQTIFHQQARPSAPITREVQTSDSQGAISKIQEVSPDNHPTDYSVVTPVPTQEQVPHALQASPGREGITPAQGEMDSPLSDAQPASKSVQEPAPDESTMPFLSSEKQGSHVGPAFEPHEGPPPDSYDAVVDKETIKPLSRQAQSLEASPDSTPAHGYVRPTKDEPAILLGQGARSSATQDPTHTDTLDSASTQDIPADSLVSPKKFRQHSTDKEDISFASNQTSDMGTQPDSSLDKVAPAEQKFGLSDQHPVHSTQETVLSADEQTKALPKTIVPQETPDMRKSPTSDTQYASHEYVPTEDTPADTSGKVQSMKPSASPDQYSSYSTRLPSSDETRNEESNDSDHSAQPFSPALHDQTKDLPTTISHPEISPGPGTSKPPTSDVYDGVKKVSPDYQLIDESIPSQEQVSHMELASKTNERPTEIPAPAPLMDVHDSISTQDMHDGDLDKARSSSTVEEAKMPRIHSAPAPRDQYDSTLDDIASARQKIALEDQDSANFAKKSLSIEPKENTVAAPDQTKATQPTIGQQEILSKEKDPSSDVQYDSVKVQEVTPKDQRIDGSIPSQEQVPNVGRTSEPREGPFSDSRDAIVGDRDSDQYPELPSSAKSRKEEPDVGEADETKAKQMTFGLQITQPAPVPSEEAREVGEDTVHSHEQEKQPLAAYQSSLPREKLLDSVPAQKSSTDAFGKIEPLKPDNEVVPAGHKITPSEPTSSVGSRKEEATVDDAEQKIMGHQDIWHVPGISGVTPDDSLSKEPVSNQEQVYREQYESHTAGPGSTLESQLGGTLAAEVVHAEQKSTLSDEQSARATQPLSSVEPSKEDTNVSAADQPEVPQTIFRQEARTSAPITREVQTPDNLGAISKIQEISPDNQPTDYSALPPVPTQEQVPHAPQTSPDKEGITPARGEMDSPFSDAQLATQKVEEPAPDDHRTHESTMPFFSSEKQGSHVEPAVEPREGPLPNSYGAVVDKETIKSLSMQAQSLEASSDATPTHGYVHPTSGDEPAILLGQGAQSSATQEPTHPDALDSASNQDVPADSLVGPMKLEQHSTDQEDISFASNQTLDRDTQPDSSLGKVAPAEQKFGLSDQDPVHPAQETVLAAAEQTKALPKPIVQQETPGSRKPPTSDTQYASQIIPSQEKVAPDVPSQEKDSQAEHSFEPPEGSIPPTHGSIVDEKNSRPLASLSSDAVLDLTPASGNVHPTSGSEPPRSVLPVQEAQTPSATQTPPPFASHESVPTEDIPADANGKVHSMKPSASPDATTPGEVALSEQKLASAGRDSSHSTQLPSSDEPRNEEINDADHSAQPFLSAAPDQAKDLQTTFGQPDISPAPGTSESPSSDVYDGARKVNPDYQLSDKSIPSQEQVSHPELASKTNGGPTETPGPAPLMDVHDSISTRDMHDRDLDKARSSSTDREAKMPRMRSASALNDQYDSIPDNIASAKQKIALEDQDSANFARKYLSSEPKEEENTVASPDQTKETQTTVGQQDILPALSKEKDPSSDVQYDSVKVQEVAPKDQHIDGSIPSQEQVPNVGRTSGPREGPFSDSHGAIVEEPMTHITGPTSAPDTQQDQDSDQYLELPSSGKSRKEETDVAEADETKGKQMTFGQPAPVPSEATRSVIDKGEQQPQLPGKVESPPSFETLNYSEYTQNVSDETVDKNKSSGPPSVDQEVKSPTVVPASGLDPQHVTVPDKVAPDDKKIAMPDLTHSAQPPFSAEPTKEETAVDASDQAKASETIIDEVSGQEHDSFSEESTTDSRGAITGEKATTSTSGREKGSDASVLTETNYDVHPPTVRNLPGNGTQPPESTQNASVEASGKAKPTDQEDMKPMASLASTLDTQRDTNGDEPVTRFLHDQGAPPPELTQVQPPPESPPDSASQHDVPTDVLDKTKKTKPTSTDQEGMAPTAGPGSTLESHLGGTLAAEVVHAEQKSTMSDQESARATQPLSSVEPSKEDTNVSAADQPEVPQTIFHQEARTSAPITREVQTPDNLGAIRKIQEISPDNQPTDYSALPPVPTQGQVPHAPQRSTTQEQASHADIHASKLEKPPMVSQDQVSRDEGSSEQHNGRIADVHGATADEKMELPSSKGQYTGPDSTQINGDILPTGGYVPSTSSSNNQEAQPLAGNQAPPIEDSSVSTSVQNAPANSLQNFDSPRSSTTDEAVKARMVSPAPAPDAPQDKDSTHTQLPPSIESSQKVSKIVKDDQTIVSQPSTIQDTIPSSAGSGEPSSSDSTYPSVKNQEFAPNAVKPPLPTTDMDSVHSPREASLDFSSDEKTTISQDGQTNKLPNVSLSVSASQLVGQSENGAGTGALSAEMAPSNSQENSKGTSTKEVSKQQQRTDKSSTKSSRDDNKEDNGVSSSISATPGDIQPSSPKGMEVTEEISKQQQQTDQSSTKSSKDDNNKANGVSASIPATPADMQPSPSKESMEVTEEARNQQKAQDSKEQVEKTEEQNTGIGEPYQANVQSPQGSKEQVEETDEQNTGTGEPEKTNLHKNMNQMNNGISQEEALDQSGKQASGVQPLGRGVSKSTEGTSSGIQTYNKSENSLMTSEEHTRQPQAKGSTQGEELERPALETEHPKERDPQANSNRSISSQSQAQASDRSEGQTSSTEDMNGNSRKTDGSTNDTTPGDTKDNPSR